MFALEYGAGHAPERLALMGTRLGNWAIVFGSVIAFAGLCVLPAAFGKSPELMPVGAVLFSLGAITIAGGIYMKASAIQAVNAEAAVVQGPAFSRKVRGGCDLCGTEIPAVVCKVHQLHLCGDCLGQHYDVRSCIYVPTSRRPSFKLGQAKARSASIS